MKILGMGMPELLIILAVILLIFGPKNLPKLGASIGKTVKSLREGLGADKEISDDDEVDLVVEDDKPSKGSSKKAVKVAKKADSAD